MESSECLTKVVSNYFDYLLICRLFCKTWKKLPLWVESFTFSCPCFVRPTVQNLNIFSLLPHKTKKSRIITVEKRLPENVWPFCLKINHKRLIDRQNSCRFIFSRLIDTALHFVTLLFNWRGRQTLLRWFNIFRLRNNHRHRNKGVKVPIFFNISKFGFNNNLPFVI